MELLYRILTLVFLISMFILISRKFPKFLEYLLVLILFIAYNVFLILNMQEQNKKEIQNKALEVYRGNTELIINENYTNGVLVSCDSIVNFY